MFNHKVKEREVTVKMKTSRNEELGEEGRERYEEGNVDPGREDIMRNGNHGNINRKRVM